MDIITRNNLQNIMRSLTAKDVHEVNQMLREVIARDNVLAKGNFVVGDTVEFTSSRTGQIMRGTIMKKNPKTVQVRVINSGLWRVPPTMLRKVAG